MQCRDRLDFGDAHSAAEQGLKVVTAQFKGVEPFRWDIFDGFYRMRVLTYSASAPMIVRMLDRHSFEFFECVFGYEGGLGQATKFIEFQRNLTNQVLDSTLQLVDKRKQIIFERIHAGKARFYVVKDNIAHAKLYLLETEGGVRRRVVVGSANFSERAFGGKQTETLIVFDNDAQAWEHYSREYDAVKLTASDRIDMSVVLQEAGIGYLTYTEEREEGTTEIPRRAELKLPILVLLAQGPMENRDIVDAIAELYALTEEERTRVIDSVTSIFEREVWGAKHSLRADGLIDYPTRDGSARPTSITARGLRYLKENS